MASVACQFAIYPLGQEHLGAALEEALRALEELGLSYAVGPMSTELHGEEEQVFAALRRAFGRAASQGGLVMVATLSNVCGV